MALSLLTILAVGCGGKDEAADSKPAANAAPVDAKGGSASAAPAIGVNPDYKGPADGGVGSKSGGK